MADLPTNLGHNSVGEPGDSMRGVTGREPVYAMKYEETYSKDGSMFDLPVDSEHKAKTIKLFSFAQPHMRSFHLAWFGFFLAFCSAFAAPPLIPIIRDNLNLDKNQLGNSGIAAITGAIVSRIVMGTVCDTFGPRYGSAFLLLGTVPCVAAMASVTTYLDFLAVRFTIGFVLATFVSCQYWMSSMFSTNCVGLANGLSAGWGNLGGGAVQLLMPSLYDLIHQSFHSPSFTAWRIAFLIPAASQMLFGCIILLVGQDCPDGQYLDMAKKGERKMDSPSTVIWIAITNYRTWVLVLSYGYSFGVELTVDNVISQYFYDRFELDVTTAGFVAASFGMMNLFSRPSGGLISDMMAKRFGMRGRLWCLWVFQTLNGVFCVLLGKMNSLGSAVIVLLLFSYFCQAACGLTYGVVPFISRRALGVISGLVGAGGNAGSALTQQLFFTDTDLSTEDGIMYMGYMIIGCTLPVLLLYFPQWGGMFLPASSAPSATEEDYYAAEYSEKEREENKHETAMKFAENSRTERGASGLQDFNEKGPNV